MVVKTNPEFGVELALTIPYASLVASEWRVRRSSNK